MNAIAIGQSAALWHAYLPEIIHRRAHLDLHGMRFSANYQFIANISDIS